MKFLELLIVKAAKGPFLTLGTSKISKVEKPRITLRAAKNILYS